ncbi:MAG: acyl esterase [Pedobacter sp.]|nr:MAG: acyl esterase [Pedobacter sp.]
MTENLYNNAKALKKATYEYEFSICSLVTRKDEYDEMVDSFQRSGFTDDICEFIYADNTRSNLFDAYEAINYFLRKANGKYIILCHQDILINKDNIADLRKRLYDLDVKDQNWAICSNSGAAGPNHVVYHISYPDGNFMNKGKFPLKVSAIDENFILVKNDAFLKVSNDLKGFHLYGADLCLQAELNGYSAYVIAFNLTHKSRGNKNEEFYVIKKKLISKYDNFFRNRWIQTNVSIFYLSGSIFKLFYGNSITLFFTRIFNGIKKKI